MSYASANQNSKTEFDLSKTYLSSIGKHLNKALDTKEYILHDRRKANIQEVERVITALPPNSKEIKTMHEELRKHVSSALRRSISKTTITFISTLAFGNMLKVLQNGFIDGWKRMNVYHAILSDLFLHSKSLSASPDSTEVKQWSADLLKVQLIVSKLSLYHLDRVHDAYHRAVPLVNTSVTPNGSYDGLYLTEKLFEHTHDINDTYTRLRGHITKYIEYIDIRFHLANLDSHKGEVKNVYNNDFILSFADYDRDLKKYESLIIKQPIEKLKKAIGRMQNNLKDIRIYEVIYYESMYVYHHSFDHMTICSEAFHNTSATDTLKAYLDDLKNNRRTSKLYIAREFQSKGIMQLLDNFKDADLRTRGCIRTHMINANYFSYWSCELYSSAENLLLQGFFSNLNHHFSIIRGSEKSAMVDYFKLKDIRARIVRGAKNLTRKCRNKSYVPPHSIKQHSHRKIVAFKKTLDTLLRKTRLDGKMFRYVREVMCKCLL